MDKHTHVPIWSSKSVSLIKKKSSGAFSKVYIGKRGPLKYAIKVFNDYEIGDEYNPYDRDDLPSHVSEENAFNNLPYHPNIIFLAGKYTKDKYIHYAYEIGKQSMHGFDTSDSYPYIKQILKGIRHCHENNVIHLDLKLDNIIIMPNGKDIKIADFGHAYVTPHVYEKHTYSYDKTTLWFRSPEQLFQLYFSGYSDIWSLGCIIYELYTGRYFCQTNNEMEMALKLFKIYGTDAIPEEYKNAPTAPQKFPHFPVIDCLGNYVDLIPEEYQDILRQMLHVDHDKRPDIFEVCEIFNVDGSNTNPSNEYYIDNIIEFINDKYGQDSYECIESSDLQPFCDIITDIKGVDKVILPESMEYSDKTPFPCFFYGRNIKFEGIKENFSYKALYLKSEVIKDLKSYKIEKIS